MQFLQQTWSEVSNIPVSELNIMEIEFLSALDYNVFVSEEQYLAWMSECDRLIAMDSRRKYRPMKTPSVGKPSIRSSSSTGGLGKSTLPPLVHSMSQPILPATTSLKRSASSIQSTPKRMCLPNTPPPDDMFQYNILPPLVRSRAPPPSTSQYYGSRPQTPVYTPTLTGINPFVNIPVPFSRYSQPPAPLNCTESYVSTEKMVAHLPSWSSMPTIAVQPTPIYFRPQPTLRQQQGSLSLAM